MKWLILVPVGIAIIALIVFLVKRNQKDEKDFEQQLNNDFHKTEEEKGDADIEEVVK